MAKPPALQTSIDVSLSLSLDTVIADRVEYDDEGDVRATGEVTLADIIADKAAKLVADQYRARIEKQPSYIFDPKKVAEDAIQSALGELVARTLERIVTPTDTFGTPTGEPTTLEALLSSRVEAWLVAPRLNSAGRIESDKTNMSVLIEAAVDRFATDAIKKATDTARAEVLGKLQAEQRAALAAAVETILKNK